MNRQHLLGELLELDPDAGELVYVERRGEEYQWALGAAVAAPSDAAPDAWLYFGGTWPKTDRSGFVEDLLAEMESMSSPADRCRWPLDQPWPHGH